LGLGFTTLATLLLELSLTRLFSVVFFYHFAFLAISLALFGFGAGGVFSYVIANRPGRLSMELGRLTFINSVAVVLLLWFILSRHGDMTLTTLFAVYVASAVPFFFAGTVVSLAIGEAIGRIDRAYLFDLMGAAAGCLLLVPFLDYFGGPNTVIAAGVIYAAAASIWFNRAGERALRASAVLVALVLVTLMMMNGANHIFDVRWAKGERLPEERMSKWNSFSRVGLTYVGTKGSGYWDIRIDADAATGIPNIDWSKPLSEEQKRDLLYRGAGLPYVLRPGAKTLVIGSGGGYDLARALGSGSKDVTGVEINPIIANDIMRGQMLKESYGLYRRPEVRIFVEDGRSFVRGSSEKYQVLQATLVDTWASTAAGAFALSENNLYTTDAFEDYLSHLTDDGVLAFSRWGFDPPRESLRVVSLGMEALRRLGETRAAGHVIVVREKAEDLNGWGALDTTLISRKPFAAADIERAKQVAMEKGMEVLYLPGAPVTNAFGEMLASPDPQAYWASYRYDVSPVFDDRPFFFYTVQPRDLWDYLRNANQSSADYKVNRAVPLLFGLMGLCVVATGLVMVLPRIVLGSRLPKQKGVLVFLVYFVCLGAGYILVQMALIQKFMLLLGQPTRALTVIVFSMLVASGLGSWASRRVVGDADRRLMKVLAAVAALIAVLAMSVAPMVRAAATWPMPVRMLMTVAMIAPVAFCMGMPFPSGLRRLEQRHAPSLRWAWSLNAAASVLGSVGSVMLAIYFGLRATLLMGGVLYLIALAVIALTPREKRAA
jgi:spermidine synthase